MKCQSANDFWGRMRGSTFFVSGEDSVNFHIKSAAVLGWLAFSDCTKLSPELSQVELSAGLKVPTVRLTAPIISGSHPKRSDPMRSSASSK
ncbi:GD12671 [Drosophila simulans]|uniref:GD12671 n=1 Tax=Drosophila simulans TaxID=7240 RepID=B4QJ05_DROSI|nr:GD12671 [Drosophila simulans]